MSTPLGLAASVTIRTPAQVSVSGQMVERLLWARQLLWYETARSRPLMLVIVRAHTGHQHDDFFITSDTSLAPAKVAGLYSDRWAVEDTNRNLKQYVGVQHPQSWVGDGPERGVALAVLHWFLATHADRPTGPHRPWYTTMRAPSFADALAALRRDTWSTILGAPARHLHSPQIATTLISVLADAA